MIIYFQHGGIQYIKMILHPNFFVFSMIMYTILTRHPQNHPHWHHVPKHGCLYYKMPELAVHEKTLMNKMPKHWLHKS